VAVVAEAPAAIAAAERGLATADFAAVRAAAREAEVEAARLPTALHRAAETDRLFNRSTAVGPVAEILESPAAILPSNQSQTLANRVPENLVLAIQAREILAAANPAGAILPENQTPGSQDPESPAPRNRAPRNLDQESPVQVSLDPENQTVTTDPADREIVLRFNPSHPAGPIAQAIGPITAIAHLDGRPVILRTDHPAGVPPIGTAIGKTFITAGITVTGTAIGITAERIGMPIPGGPGASRPERSASPLG
jgi:hypothetical protein